MNGIKKNAILILALVVVVTLLLYVMSAFKPKPPIKPKSEAARIPVAVISVKKVSFQVYLPSQGLVEARTQSRLSAQISGNVIATNPSFNVGGSFKRGDVLLTIDDADYKAALKITQASVNQARVALQEEAARGKQAQRDWARLGNGSEPNDLVKRKPQLMAAQAVLESAQAQMEKAVLDLSRTRVLAPYDGRVIGNAIDAANYVSRGQVLGDIVESGKLKVKLPLSAAWRHLLDWSGVNNSVQVSLPEAAEPTYWQAVIARTSADISAGSRQFRAVAIIDVESASNPGAALFIGDYVTAKIAGTQLHDVVVIPREAVYDDEYVWAIVNDELLKRPVKIAWLDENYAVIGAGLLEGEVIATTALATVFSGTPVRIIASKQVMPKHHGEESTGSSEPILVISDKQG